MGRNCSYISSVICCNFKINHFEVLRFLSFFLNNDLASTAEKKTL